MFIELIIIINHYIHINNMLQIVWLPSDVNEDFRRREKSWEEENKLDWRIDFIYFLFHILPL